MDIRINSELLWKLINAVLDNTEERLKKIYEDTNKIKEELSLNDKEK